MASTIEQERDRDMDSRERILAGALKVFATKGFVTATNKDVAAAAGIRSPGLIYHYFKDKTDLLRAVVERYAPPLQFVARPEELESLPVKEGLTRFAHLYLELMSDAKIGTAMRIVFGEALRDSKFAPVIGAIGPQRIWKLLTRYLDNQMAAGALRRIEPAHAALCFIGPLVSYLMLVRVFEVIPYAEGDPEALVANIIDIFLCGLRPQTGTSQ